LIIGSRASKLARAQANLVRDLLKEKYPVLDMEVKTIKTTGDKILDVPLDKIGDQGLFTKEIQEALLAGEIDVAVHSMKDLPVEITAGLKIAAVTQREDPRDILVSPKGDNLKSLPQKSRVGTSSLRRRAQLLRLRPDLRVLDLRGNLDTRIRKLNDGLYDAIVLAYAGVKRLGLILSDGAECFSIRHPEKRSDEGSHKILQPGACTERSECGLQDDPLGKNEKKNSLMGQLSLSVIPLDEVLPQAAQGALGIEIRQGRTDIEEMVKILDDAPAHLCIDAERAVLSGLGGGCHAPIGVYARIEDDLIIINAGVFSLDGKIAAKDKIFGDKKDAQSLGLTLVNKLLKSGAKQILDQVR